MSAPVRMRAWDLVGFDGRAGDVYGLDEVLGDGVYAVRLVGGRALYDAVVVADGGDSPRLSRLEARDGYLHQVNRYVDPDAEVELVEVAR